MAYEALRTGGVLPVAYNSGNEIAVERFVNGDISFVEIADCVAYVMRRIDRGTIDSMDSLLYFDSQARMLAKEYKKAFFSR